MKYLLAVVFSLSLISCANTKNQNRSISSRDDISINCGSDLIFEGNSNGYYITFMSRELTQKDFPRIGIISNHNHNQVRLMSVNDTGKMYKGFLGESQSHDFKVDARVAKYFFPLENGKNLTFELMISSNEKQKIYKLSCYSKL